MVWYAETGIEPNKLVRFDPKAKTISSVTPIPSGGGVVRNMAATSDGKVYLACSGVNRVGIAEVSR
jgi:virginiamycin B lyase